jgi:hypothetical protein
MIYATQHSSAGRIDENADIVAFETEDQARAWLLQPYDSAWDHSNAEIEPGRFGDFWVSDSAAPVIEGDKLIAGSFNCHPFDADQLYVAAPGSHPGGRQWWIEPIPGVLVVTSILEMDD